MGPKEAWERRPMTSLGSQLHRATFLTALLLLLLLQVKGVKTLIVSASLEGDKSQKDKVSSEGG